MSKEIEIPETNNRKLALLIAILAMVLALAEIGGKQSDGDSVAANIEASNLWSFFQAKTIRRTSVQLAAEEMETRLITITDPAVRDVFTKRIADWKATAARYESEPETKEGRKELMARAKDSENKRDFLKARSELFEIASALLQIGIVVASAAIITGIVGLAFIGGGLGAISLLFMALAMYAPMAVTHFIGS